MQYISHEPIIINDLTISFQSKSCIDEPFNTQIYSGSRIGIIGRNGSGKSSLIKILAGFNIIYDGMVTIPNNIILGYIPQLIINEDDQLSGGQRFNKHLSRIISLNPNLLLLDEPTNHLDRHNRESLFGFLKRYNGTLIIITHDLELLNFVNTIWHVANGAISQFNGSYTDYMRKHKDDQDNLLIKVKQLNNEKRQAHQNLMHEQTRAKNSRLQGEKHIKERKWPTITSGAKSRRAETTSGKNKKNIESNRQDAINGLQNLYIPEIIIPKFNLDAGYVNVNKIILNIEGASCGYLTCKEPVLNNINLRINAFEKVVLLGNNGSGKSTLLKAILNDNLVNKTGIWESPNISDIGYVDQHYSNLNLDKTAVELIQELIPNWSYKEIRDHLNSFLLRKNEEVNLAVKFLSGGEKVRLNLALIAAKPPKLLILDEITNNVDMETKEHLTHVLKDYPGTMLLVCHDQYFVDTLLIDSYYTIGNQIITPI